ncbi:FAD-binding oxidoreductase [Roseisolibacter sp. H3M3-2]|uniref:FAD-binding oxidoreductase n=1 Tax=Roseisolibacter sp. H3M3-2 TaxID=3031323 RepID=UPI0023DA79FD|nr:FAD-binding oxidoreductase [Roseisolibacter sp. H3M3-2]MDF1502449.1 FAD-binding oxidoreductase [Roseisolibacter sp. H3M3-2]
MGVSIPRSEARPLAPAADVVEELRAGLRGALLTPESPEYDRARAVWNGMIDRHPGLIVRALGAADVAHAVRVAARHRLTLAVRGGGHNIAGNALCDGGLVIDTSAMRGVRVDPERRTARVDAGALLGDFDREAQAFGLATPLGINSTTGVAGLTLGGGYGWLSRLHGLTVDNLLSVDVVTADGVLRRASEAEHPDLFWALRGGGGNFGVVTSFEYALHPVGPTVIAGLLVHPFDDARALLRRYREAAAAAPDALAAWVVLRKAPPLPALPAEVHGREVVVIAACWAGAHADAEAALRPLRAIGRPHADLVGPAPYAAFQTAFDPLMGAGARNYWKSHNFPALPDPLIEVLVSAASDLPGPQTDIAIAQLGGAVARRPESATAYAGRRTAYTLNVHGRWDRPEDDDRFVEWARGVYRDTAPFAGDGAYVNFMTHDEGERVAAAYGANFARLAEVKRRYDPDNLFRVNQNIRPAS